MRLVSPAIRIYSISIKCIVYKETYDGLLQISMARGGSQHDRGYKLHQFGNIDQLLNLYCFFMCVVR